MPLKRFILFVPFVLLSAGGIRAAPQLTTALPLGVDDGTGNEDGEGILSGIIAGTGPDGTTFILTPGATDSGAIPITATVVENASGFTANFVASSGDFVLTQFVGCALNGGTAECTEAVVQVSDSLTASQIITTSGTPALATIVASSSSAPSSGAASAPAPTQSSQASNAQRKFVAKFADMLIPICTVVVVL